MRLAFIKCHGSGNDFPLVDARALSLSDAEWGGVARALAARDGPVGGDGLLLLTRGGARHAFGQRMFNPDGTEAETCLNGLRCTARLGLEAYGLAEARVALPSSEAQVRADAPLAPGVATIEERAGPADLDVAAWPLRVGLDRVVDAALPPLDPHARFTAVAMPNPHLVRFVDRVDEAELVRIGLLCEAAPPWLPNRANVSFVEARPDGLFVRTHERGVGLTDACGSAIAASTYAACLTARIAWDQAITVWNRGGPVRARAAPDGMVTLSGNATFEWAGEAEVDPATAVARALVVTHRFDAETRAWAAALAEPTPA